MPWASLASNQDETQAQTPASSAGGWAALGAEAAPAQDQTKPEPKTQSDLPAGAKGFDAAGNPYFGDGLAAMGKKWMYNFTKDIKPVDDSAWHDLKDRWNQTSKAYDEARQGNVNNTDVNAIEKQNQAGKELLSTGIDYAKTEWDQLTSGSQGSLLAGVLKGTSATVGAVLDAFQIPAKDLEKALGAGVGAQEAINNLDSLLPRLDDNQFMKVIMTSIPPIGLVYDAARVALSPDQGKFDKIESAIKDGWQSGRILYSQVFDASLKEKFLRDYHAGADPELLAEKMQNPLAEMAGQLILDPLNIVGGFLKDIKSGKELLEAQKATEASGLLKLDEGAQAFAALQKAEEPAQVAKAMDSLVTAQRSAIAAVQNESKVLNVGYGIHDITTTSRQEAAVSKGKDLLGNMALLLKNSGMSSDGIGEAILYGVKSVSQNAEEMHAGLSGISHLPNAHMFLSDDYIQTFTVMKNLMADENGIVDGGRLAKLMESKNITGFSAEAQKLMARAAHSSFPSVSELQDASKIAADAKKAGLPISLKTEQMAKQFEDLPNHVKAFNEIHNQLSKVRNPINSLLGKAYFNWQGGVAVKNILANNELIMLDKGVGAWFKDGKYWSLENVSTYIKDIYGELPTGAHGFESLVQAGTGEKATIGLSELQAAKGIGEKVKVLAKGLKEQQAGLVMNVGEEGSALRVIAASVRDSFKKLLPKIMPDLSAEIKAGTMTDKQVAKLNSLVYENNGNVQKAISSFRDFYKTGYVEDWRNLDFVTDAQKAALEHMDIYKPIQDLAHNGAATPAEIESVFENLNKTIDNRAGMAIHDTVSLSESHPSVAAWGDMMQAVKEGHFNANDEKVFTAFMEGAEQARLEYKTLLDNVALKAQTALNKEGKLQEAQKIGQQMNEIRAAVDKSGPATAKITNAHTQEAWSWVNQVKAEKKPTIEYLRSVWQKANLPGVAPGDLTKDVLFQTIFKERFNKVSLEWGKTLDTVFGESETILKQLGAVVDSTELDSMASRARNLTEQAHALRSATFEKGLLKVPHGAPKSVLELASQYGFSTATEAGIPNDKKLLNVINKFVGGQEAEQASKTVVKATDLSLAKAVDVPRSALPPEVSDRIGQEAKRLASELSGGTVEKSAVGGRIGTSNVSWYQDAYQKGLQKPEIDKALQKIVEDHGKDKGVNVQRMKEIIIDNFTHGAPDSGTPPDLNVLKSLGAPEATMQKALDAFNEITHSDMTLEEAIKASGGTTTTAAKTAGKFAKVEDVPMDVAKKALEDYRSSKGFPPVSNLVAVPPPHPIGGQPTAARSWLENRKGTQYTLDSIKNNMLQRWGHITKESQYSPEMETALQKIASHATPKAEQAKAVALRVADEQRKFTLLNYGERTYGDVAMSYVLPYHFFYTRSYGNWVNRVATNPEIVAGYAKYRHALETMHKDLPDWYKQQLNVNPFAQGAMLDKPGEMLGIHADNPLFINLESSMNPLYGLTGTDFNDPVKRTNWATATMDDMGKFGPTLWAPIQMGIAAKLFMDGNTDAASRWGNRLIPETAQVKAVASMFGKTIEIDPAVQMFSGNGLLDTGAMDPYERGRMGYAASQLVSQGASPEEVAQQFQAQSGDLWEKAKVLAIQSRAGSSVSSFFLGVGFKPRSSNDLAVESMYTDLNKLYSLSGDMSKDQYKQAWDDLRTKYDQGTPGLVDTVLLAKKGGSQRDAAYAFNVLGRLPPGQMSEVFKTLGISSTDVSKFYDSKGFSDPNVKFTDTEKQRFMAAIVDMGAMLKMPDSATREEWTQVRNDYSKITDGITKQLGADIWDKVSLYYTLKTDHPDQADAFKQAHPEVIQALQLKQAGVVANPQVDAYYGGVDTIEAYLSGNIRNQLEQKYGKDINDKQQKYFDLGTQTPALAKAYLRAHPELKAYWAEKATLDKQSNQMFVEMGSKLPSEKGAQLREDFTPQSGVQKDLANTIQTSPNQTASWQEITNGMPQGLQDAIIKYWESGTKLSHNQKNELDYLAQKNGYYDGNDMLRKAGLALNDQGQPQAQAATPVQSGWATP